MSLSKATDAMSASNDAASKEERLTEHIDDYAGHDTITIHPNAWSKYRLMMREYVAEFLGVCILIIFGTGVDCQVVLSSVTGVASSQKGSYLSINFGWAIGTAMGVWVSGGISGGHINPAVTIALATWRGFPWKKVPGYIAAQTLGGLVGAALVYANYYHAISIFEGGDDVRTLSTASLFSTYALSYMTSVSAFFSEFLATAVLVVVVLAIGDQKNLPPPAGLAPLVLFLLILGIGACLGMETGYAINPARDLGPRILTAMVGYGKQVFTFRNQYWLWCPIIAPILGAQAGAIFYDAFIYLGDESPFNKPRNATARARHEHAAHSMRKNMPAGPGADDQV
ncbi:aquaporin-like protein [Mycena epipterygia]|nr:aquaporin-like protein [Mycena epipterygia]